MYRRTQAPAPLPLLLSDEAVGATAPAGFEAWCAQHPGQVVNLWLGADLTLSLLAEPGAHFADEAALVAYTRRVLGHYSHEGAHEGQGAVAAWRSGSQHGACLLQGVALADLQASAARHGVRIAGAWPCWAVALAAAGAQVSALRRRGRLLVAEGRVVTSITLEQGRVKALTRHWLPRGDAAELAALPALEPGAGVLTWGIGHSLPGTAPSLLRVIGALDAAWSDMPNLTPMAPDFVRAAPRPARLGWAFAASALLVLGVAGWDAHEARNSGADGAAAQVPVAPASLVKTATDDIPPAERQAALARLSHPWPDIFTATETALPRGGQWRSLEHRVGHNDIRLTGTAASTADALQVAQRLGRAPGLADALLTRIEPAAGSGTVEFELTLRLAPARQP
jgi:hypothetical protein